MRRLTEDEMKDIVAQIYNHKEGWQTTVTESERQMSLIQYAKDNACLERIFMEIDIRLETNHKYDLHPGFGAIYDWWQKFKVKEQLELNNQEVAIHG